MGDTPPFRGYPAGAHATLVPNLFFSDVLSQIEDPAELIAEELRATEEECPREWIEAAFREAAAQNRRSWRYVARILERWRDEGRTDAAVGRVSEGKRDLAGRYRGLIQR